MLRSGVAIGASVILLSGCFLVEGPTPEVLERDTERTVDPSAELVPDGTAEDNLPYFEKVLDEFSQGDAAVEAKPITTALIDAGFDKQDMQVSFDESKTNLQADNIFVSVRYDDTCLMGQVVTADRSYVAELVAAVGPDGDICIIGNTQEITW